MKIKFDVVLLEEVWELFDTLDEKTKDKIIYNIDKSRYSKNPNLLQEIER